MRIPNWTRNAHRWAVPLSLSFAGLAAVANQPHKTRCVEYVAKAGEQSPADPGGIRWRHPGGDCMRCHADGYTTETWVTDWDRAEAVDRSGIPAVHRRGN
jgi:hypothetical protein